MLNIENSNAPKTFWERPEGVTGQIVGVALLAAGGYALYHALPFIITLLQNTIYATLLGVVTAVLLMIVTDKRFWRLGTALYESAMRKITSVFVTIDPIGIMKNYIDRLEVRLQDLGKQVSSIMGMIRQCEQEINENTTARNRSMTMMSTAKKQNKTMDLALAAREVGRMDEANVTYQDMLAKLQLNYRVLCKYQEVSEFLIRDMRSEVKVKERKKQMMDKTYSAIRAARAIINGDPDERRMFDMANEYTAQDYAMKLGEIDDFARVSQKFMNSVDLQNGMFEQAGLDMLAQWEQNAESLVLGDQKRLMLENAPSESMPVIQTATPQSVDLMMEVNRLQKNL